MTNMGSFSFRDRVLAGLLFFLAIVYLIFKHQASEALFNGHDIYSMRFGESPVFPYYGSPVLALLIVPFTWLSFPIAAAIWKIFSLFFLYRTWVLLEGYLNLKRFSNRQHVYFTIGSFFSIAFMLYRNFHLIQFTIFLLYSILEGLDSISKGRKMAGAGLIALGCICKVLPIVAIPYLIYRKETRSALYVVLCTMALLSLPLFVFGIESGFLMLQEWAKSINPSDDMNIFDVSTNDIHGVTTLISTLFIENIGFEENTLHIKRNIFNLEPIWVVFFIQAARLGLMAFTLYFLRSLPFKTEENKEKQLWEVGYILAIVPLIFPQQRLYAFYFLFPAITYVVYQFVLLVGEKKQMGHQVSWLLCLYLVAMLVFKELIVGNYKEYYWHFKTVTYSAFLLLAVYCQLVPALELKTNKV